jgi:small redox-active disulfide protein 2
MKRIKILGTGCPKCDKLADIVQQVAKTSGIECEIIKVTGIEEILSFNILSTPALVIDGKLMVSGRIPKPEEIMHIISE